VNGSTLTAGRRCHWTRGVSQATSIPKLLGGRRRRFEGSPSRCPPRVRPSERQFRLDWGPTRHQLPRSEGVRPLDLLDSGAVGYLALSVPPGFPWRSPEREKRGLGGVTTDLVVLAHPPRPYARSRYSAGRRWKAEPSTPEAAHNMLAEAAHILPVTVVRRERRPNRLGTPVLSRNACSRLTPRVPHVPRGLRQLQEASSTGDKRLQAGGQSQGHP
jgi:hypothetical protein